MGYFHAIHFSLILELHILVLTRLHIRTREIPHPSSMEVNPTSPLGINTDQHPKLRLRTVKYMKHLKPPARYWLRSQEFVNHHIWSNIAQFFTDCLRLSSNSRALPHPPHSDATLIRPTANVHVSGTTFSVQDNLTSSRGFHWWPQVIDCQVIDTKPKSVDQSKGIMSVGPTRLLCWNIPKLENIETTLW